jgi:hypothetical protein
MPDDILLECGSVKHWSASGTAQRRARRGEDLHRIGWSRLADYLAANEVEVVLVMAQREALIANVWLDAECEFVITCMAAPRSPFRSHRRLKLKPVLRGNCFARRGCRYSLPDGHSGSALAE